MSRVDRILEVLDVGLQSSREHGYGTDHASERCARCRAAEPSDGDFCSGCRAFLLEDTDTDPAEPRVEYMQPGSVGDPWPTRVTGFVAYFYDELRRPVAGPTVIPERLDVYRRPRFDSPLQWVVPEGHAPSPEELTLSYDEFELVNPQSEHILYYQRRT